MIKTIIRMYFENEKNPSVQNAVMFFCGGSAIFFFMNGKIVEAITCVFCFGAIFCPAFGFTYQNYIKNMNSKKGTGE